jgi:hypothetical protein
LGEVLGHPASPEAIAGAIAANSLENLRATNYNHHFWQGRPGLWKALLPASEARRIARAHPEIFEGGGCACDPDEGLDHSGADANWLQLELKSLRGALAETRSRLAASQGALGETREQVAALGNALGEARIQLEATVARLASFEELRSPIVDAARELRRLSRRFPRLASVVRRRTAQGRHGASHHPNPSGSRSSTTEIIPTEDLAVRITGASCPAVLAPAPPG